MNTTVWKFPFMPGDVISFEMPAGAEPLHIDVQNGRPCLWARVNPEAPREVRRFRMAGTGHGLAADVGRHVGSWQMQGGALVFHLFELP